MQVKLENYSKNVTPAYVRIVPIKVILAVIGTEWLLAS